MRAQIVPFVGVSSQHLLAVLLAVTGAVLLGLAAVRQHGAVQQAVALEGRGGEQSLQAFWRMVRTPGWLAGALQGFLGGSLHVIALTLAPITLVQPIGVLAVPVTGVASAIKDRRRPGLRQIIGTLISIASVVGVTSLLLAPSRFGAMVLPSVSTVVVTVGVATMAALVVARQTRGTPPLVRAGSLAVTAAAMFGLTSVLVHTAGTIINSGGSAVDQSLLITTLFGMAVMLPTGVWAMQTAYISGSPQVVICCLTLIDPLTAVLGGHLLLHDGVPITSVTLLAAIGCALLAAVGVVLLSKKNPVQPGLLPGSSHDPPTTTDFAPVTRLCAICIGRKDEKVAQTLVVQKGNK